MSLVHMYMKRSIDTSSYAEYRVVCGDLPDVDIWTEVAHIIIDKHTNTYTFHPINEWKKEKIIPPMLYALNKRALKGILEREYNGYGWGAWTCRIHEWTTRLIKEKTFPEQAPQPRITLTPD